ncbi:MAG: hypothetical protein ACI8RN_000645 [Glaciecola sp.]|jgi:hypothetical protein|uniref:hypothetical protein n=1 Tax=Congregibacter sp. TaxID=2744308 RepID=UPI0039E3588B
MMIDPLSLLSIALVFFVMAWYRKTKRQISAVAASLFALGGFGLLRSAFSKASI